MDVTVGLAAHHLNSPKVGQITNAYPLSQRYLLFVSAEKNINRQLKHKLALSIISQRPSQQIVPSYSMTFDFPENDDVAVSASLATRISRNVQGYLNDAVLISVGINSRTWHGCFSYEINTSGLSFITRGNGAMELTLGYYILEDN